MRKDTKIRPGRAMVVSMFAVLMLFSIVDFAAAQQPENTENQFSSTRSGAICDDYAQLMAGMPDSQSALAPFESRPAWVEYSKFFHQSWMNLDKRLLLPERAWSERELGDAASSKAVFYPFSGPDFANVNAFFPEARTYVLVALEPLGDIPRFGDMSGGQFESYLQSMKNSLHDLLSMDYFVSAHMDAQIEQTKIKGVLPILLLMLAQSNAKVLDVRYWTMGIDGQVHVLPVLGTTTREIPAIRSTKEGLEDVEGIRIIFHREGSDEQNTQTLYYFYLNLNNQTFDYNRRFLYFLKSLGPFTTFMKSASYVMFDRKTSHARQFMFDNSRYIVQEDSGIPLKYFDPSLWSLRFYGHYSKPISTFKEAYQPDLASIYRTDKNIKPLPFGFGYFYNPGKSNLIFAEKKSEKRKRDEEPYNNPDDKHFLYNNALFDRGDLGS